MRAGIGYAWASLRTLTPIPAPRPSPRLRRGRSRARAPVVRKPCLLTPTGKGCSPPRPAARSAQTARLHQHPQAAPWCAAGEMPAPAAA
ncbi:hypothetical protein XpiCFBP4643_22745 [Xanthomonas pisi]|uniref:Uncharacterized protein n=1 Tax=Xanthomonas pisi TaxID=56457 RepID=A0A2S7CRB3_9XANT|nr:hypothetical protein XpiCFBP4643_22745 [Xanthomonas pisi]